MEADPGKGGNVIKSRGVELALITKEDEHVYMQWSKVDLRINNLLF